MSISVLTVFVVGFLIACITLSVGMYCNLELLSEILEVVRRIERSNEKCSDGEEQS